MKYTTIWDKRMAEPRTAQMTAPMSSKQRRAPRLRLRARDVEIVDAVHRLRVLSTDQIAQLFFPTAGGEVSTACRERLRRLVQAGYLERGEQAQRRGDGRLPYLFMLTEKGSALLQEQLGLDPEEIEWKPSYNDPEWSFLRHQLGINNFYVAVLQAVQDIGWSLQEWADDRILRAAHVDRVRLPGSDRLYPVVPDAYFQLHGPDGRPQMHFFLEIDRATMSVAAVSHRVKSWQDKIRAYQVYVAGTDIQERYGTNKIRVLTVTTGEKRLANLKAATEAVGGQSRYWFTTERAVTAHAILRNPIWQRASTRGATSLVTHL